MSQLHQNHQIPHHENTPPLEGITGNNLQEQLAIVESRLDFGIAVGNQEKAQKNFLQRIGSEIYNRLKSIKKVEKQDAMAKRLLEAEEFIQGKTLIHQTQIDHLKGMIPTTDDKSLKTKWSKELEEMEKSFEALITFKNFIETLKATWEGGGFGGNEEGISKTEHTIMQSLRKLFAAGIPASFLTIITLYIGAFSGAVESSNLAPTLGIAFGVPFIGKLAMDKIFKMRAEKKLKNILLQTLDLNTLVKSAEWQGIKGMHDNLPTKRKSYEMNDRKIRPYYYQYCKEPLENPTLQDMYAFYDNRVAENRKSKKP